MSLVVVLSLFVSCSQINETNETSSDYADKAWLENRIGDIPKNVTVGTADSIGIDMSDFEDDGYIIRNLADETVICGKTDEGLDLAVRAYAKAYEAGRTIENTYHEGYRIDRFTIDGVDISEYKIVYEGESDNAGTERNNAYFAATELKRLIKKACGADLEIVHTDCEKMIKISYLNDGNHGENGFTYEVKNGNLYISGVGKANGCANGVYYFLQEECGWNELLYGDNDLLENEWLNIENGTSTDVDPMFDYCLPSPVVVREFNQDHSLYYGYIQHACHGQNNYKWGGYEVGAKQICYTDEVVKEAVFSDILYYLEINRDRGNNIRFIDIAHGDNVRFCLCNNCSKVFKEENNSNAGPIVRFANELVEYISEEGFDEVAVGMFAYQGTNIPTVTHPDKNVYVTYCTDHDCAVHYLDGSDEDCTMTTTFLGAFGNNKHFGNSDFGKWLRGWSEICENVYIWQYGLDLYGHELTQDYNFYHDFMFFKECNVKGVYYDGADVGFGENRLRFEEFMFLQYHPDVTEEEYDEAVREIYEREFGDGAQNILTYTKNIWSVYQLAAGCSGFWIWDVINPEEVDYETFHAYEDKAIELLDEAIYLADSLKQEKSAKLFSCDLLYKVCWLNYFRAYDRNETAELERLSEIYDLFVQRIKDGGMSLVHYDYLNSYYDTNPLQDNLEDAAWIDWQNFRDLLTDEGAVQREIPEKYIGVELPPKASRAW